MIGDEDRLLRMIWPSIGQMAKKGAIHDIPGFREDVAQLRHRLDRFMEDMHPQYDGHDGRLWTVLNDARDELDAVLRRTARPRSVRDLTEGATPETRRKLRPDPILRLYRSGALTAREIQAAQEIRSVFHELTAALCPGVQDLGRPVYKQRRFIPRSPGESMSPHARRAFSHHYRDWSRRMGLQPIVRSNVVGHRMFDLVVAVLIDGYSLRDVERSMALRNGTATDLLRRALSDYADAASMGGDKTALDELERAEAAS